MKKSRLDDTAAIAGAPLNDLQRYESSSTSVRKIDNGYVVSESSTKDGKYECREYFSEKPPEAVDGQDSNAMSKAVSYMKREGTL